MTRIDIAVGLAIFAVALAPMLPIAQGADHEAEEYRISRPGELKWADGPASLPPGAKLAVLEGDPTKEGPFVMRVKVPDGYRVPPHVHPKTERITVISGTFNLGMGEKFDVDKSMAMPAGSYGYWAAGMKHFAWVKGETIIQLHGIGPWSIEYLNPKDDPRKSAK